MDTPSPSRQRSLKSWSGGFYGRLEWCERASNVVLLKVDHITPRTEVQLYEGGNGSRMAVRMKQQIENRVGRRVPLITERRRIGIGLSDYVWPV